VTTLANYDYAFYWNFYLDGTIEPEVLLGVQVNILITPYFFLNFQVKLTGIVSTGAYNDDKLLKQGFGRRLAPNLYAPIHQHFFCFRLHFALDDSNPENQGNSVYRVQLAPAASDHGAAFCAQATLLKTDLEAQGRVDTNRGTFWRIV